MDYAMDHILEAPCGLDCQMCFLYRAGSDATLKTVVSDKFNLPVEKANCPGCRAVSGFCPVINEQCATYRCAKDRGVEFCSECVEFPCLKLMPCANNASELPQNIKVFSLLIRKNKGREEWRRSIKEIYKRYFKGELIIGYGPILKE